MNYTDPTTIRNAMGGTDDAADNILNRFAGIASRLIDHMVCQTDDPGCIDYFLQEAVANEILLHGQINNNGHLICWPHKYGISSVSAFSYRSDPRESWIPADTLDEVIVRGKVVEFWLDLSYLRGKPVMVQISYTGGMGTSLDSLDQTILDVATIIAIRKFKEERSGMGDVVGVVELGTIQYAKGLPASVVNDLQPYIRNVPWT